MKAVIVAGGKGTRMAKLGAVIPKALIPIAGKPLIAYQIENLKRHGLRDVLLIINHLGEQIKKYCGNGRRFGVKITYYEEQKPLGTAGAIKLLEKKLKNDFIVIYGDVLINVDFTRLIKQHNRNKLTAKNLAGTLVLHPNDHPFDSDLVEADENGRITRFISKPHRAGFYFRNLVNAGLYVLTPRIHRFIPKNKAADFGKHIFPRVLEQNGALFAYNTPEYLKDMGTPKRRREVEIAVRSGKFKRSNLSHKRPAIFMDRDGVINEEVGDIRRIEDFKLIPNSAKAIKLINQHNYFAVVISNQPQVAKGFCRYEDILEFHKKMETLIAEGEGAKLDAIYFCPHHPDKGFPGENKKYKIICECRKPKTGLARRAIRDLNIALKNSVMIGDSTRDAKLAENLGIRFIGVKTGEGVRDGIYKLKAKPKVYKNLLAAVRVIGLPKS
ncbi:MAG: HAD-IIIA family hydrolase [Candidatus Doudnabacteria bacterium]|nr:HAD-IIIA family hydrolase [Candidatus Doudnabacteria bacterium]